MSRDGLLTIGVEEEYQIIDASGELRSHIDTLLANATPKLGDKVKREMMQSVVEVGTSICENVEEARAQLAEMRGTLADLLKPEGMRIACAGTHPFSSWQEQHITDHDRYKMLEEELQDVVRSLVIFGLHVHVAIPDQEMRIEVLNEARYFLPHLLALSTSSPFWMGRNTGLKSYRSVIWSNFPRTGIPPELSSYDEYENYVELLVKTHSIDNGKKIWWDLRAHPSFPGLRHADAARRDGVPGGADAGHLRQAPPAAKAQPRVPQVHARADRREQVEGGPSRHRRRAHRLRQAGRGPDARPGDRAPGLRR
jgi:glutamate---cysteine ligase / carboxylate-amine ligase